MTRGKVVLVPFPFDDLATQKARPAVCLTEPATSHRHIVLAFVTSRQPDEPLDTDVALDPQDPDFAQTGLQVRSTIRIHRLLTVRGTPLAINGVPSYWNSGRGPRFIGLEPPGHFQRVEVRRVDLIERRVSGAAPVA